MSITQITKTPQLLPFSPSGSPEAWKDQPLIQVQGFTYTSDDVIFPQFASTLSAYPSEHSGGAFYKPGTDKAVPFQTTSPEDLFTNVGTDWDTAIKTAHEEATKIVDTERNLTQNVAVLQASDGAYYITSLFNKKPVAVQLNGLQITDVTALTPDLKAVVNKNTWVDFRTQ